MKFSDAFKIMKTGIPVKLPSWGGYWYWDEENFKQWAVENGLMFLYQLVDIIETPLAAEELSAYKTLHTYSPTTIVANDAGAGMSVGYKRRK